MLKSGETDYRLRSSTAPRRRGVKRDPRLQLVASRHASIFWIEFADQWDPKSPWSDRRLRLAVNYALDRKAINEAACLGYCPPAGVIVPRVMDFALQVAAAGLRSREGQAAPRGGRLPERASTRAIRRRSRGSPPWARRSLNYLNAVGHPGADAPDGARRLLRRLAREEAARALHGGGRATRATRPAASRRSSTPRAATPTAAIPDLDELFLQQARERDPGQARSAAPPHPAAHHRPGDVRADHGPARRCIGVGPRVAEHTINVDPRLRRSRPTRTCGSRTSGSWASPASDRRAACRFAGRRARSSARASGRRAAPFPEPTRRSVARPRRRRAAG